MVYGDLGKRFVAALIDVVLKLAIAGIVVFLINEIGGLIYIPFALFISSLMWWLYDVLTEGGSGHATFGKKIMGMYVAYEDGSGISYSTAILRGLCKQLSGAFFGLGYIICIFSQEKQCLHDMLAKTYVACGEPDQVIVYGRKKGTVAARGNGPKVIGVKGPMSGMIFDVGEEGLLIGRDSVSCQIALPSSQSKVSRNHCFVTYNPMSGMFVLNDRNSTHGTYLVSGMQVLYSQPAALKSGDRFYLADKENVFEVR